MLQILQKLNRSMVAVIYIIRYIVFRSFAARVCRTGRQTVWNLLD